jgi:predicted ABC-type ATPase
MLAGPNGAGKSTFYRTYLAGLGLPFLNADVLAAEAGMEAYEAAAQIAEARRLLIERRTGFVTETVLSDPVGAKVDGLANAVAAGFDVHLIYIGIADADQSAERVATRVKAGGHDVPLAKIMARFQRTLDNLERAINRLPRVTLYDNSSFDKPYRLIAEFRSGQLHQRTNDPIPLWAERFFDHAKG